MKAATILHQARGLLIIALFVGFALPLQQARAQDSDILEPADKYSQEELAQMLAPIALYPDALLSQVLMASTYPIELIEADRWVMRNPKLKGDTLDTALLDKDWDPSVKAICHFPSTLALMSEQITETTHLGNAFLDQETEVMDMVQELRARAYAEGNLSSNTEHRVIVEKEIIIIEAADPRVIYVPYYDPFYIYGTWWYPAYRPYYWGPPGVFIGSTISYWPSIHFSFVFGSWSYFDWHHHHIYIDTHTRPVFVRRDRWIAQPGRWHHAPHHRRGVAYHNRATTKKFGQTPYRSKNFRRNGRNIPDYRDRDRRIRIDRDRREAGRKKIDRDVWGRERVKRESSIRERAVRDKRKPERVERDPQLRQRSDPERRSRQQLERAQQQKHRDDVSNSIEKAKEQRQSSERQRDGSRDWGRLGDKDKKSRRDVWYRNKQ